MPHCRRLQRPARLALVVTLAIAGMAGASVFIWHRFLRSPGSADREREPTPTPGLPAPDPRLSYQGPFRNVHPDVPYVGDAACAECHAKETRTYRRHPMALTLAPIRQAASPPLDGAHHNPFEALGKSFRVAIRDGRTFHTHSLQDDQGKPICAHEMELQYVIGSGSRGISYLTERDGAVLQSPITWYPQKARWDLSPGFTADMLAGRTIGGACLFCHTNQASEEAHSERSYLQPIFPKGHGIGCERCHGPGGEHVKKPRRVKTQWGDLDPTIVNPKHLSPALRESICWQCHLEGAIRVLRRGRERYDFRPGLPLEDFLAIFQDASETSHNHVVNHVEQMVLSRCYQKTAGEKKLGCISCHDPHEKPPPDRTMMHFRAACVKCHEEKPCALPVPQRLAQNKDDSCIACHMPRYSATTAAHVSPTNHRIPRKPEPPHPDQVTATKRIEAKDLVSFFSAHRDRVDPEITRDRAVASALLAQEGGRMAQPFTDDLAQAVRRDPGDVEAKALYAMALLNVGQPSEALPLFRDVLARVKHHERGLIGVAKCCEELDRLDEALAMRQLLVKLHPPHASYRFHLVGLLLRLERWKEAGREARAWLAIDPTSLRAHHMLRQSLLALDEIEEAEAEKRIILELQRR